MSTLPYWVMEHHALLPNPQARKNKLPAIRITGESNVQAATYLMKALKASKAAHMMIIWVEYGCKHERIIQNLVH